MAQTVRLTFTPEGINSIMRQGALNTIKAFSVTDDLLRYDVTGEWDGEPSYFGGTRQLRTTTPTCQYSTTGHITKFKQPDTELVKSQQELQWYVELNDCDKNLSALNPTITVDLDGYFNYLESLFGVENYNFNNKLDLYLFDNINAVVTQLDASTFTYNRISNSNYEKISYVLDSESCGTYSNFNTYQMTVQDGKKLLKDNSRTKNYSPLQLYFNTEDDKNGVGDMLKLTINPPEYGYVTKLKDNTDREFLPSDFVSIQTLESMTEDQIFEKYRLVVPAARTSRNNSKTDLYYLTDYTGTYAQGIDNLPTLAYRFFNSNGENLLGGLINKAKKFIQVSFTETSSGIYEQTMKFKVANKTVNGVSYMDKQIKGGYITVKLKFNINNTTPALYNDIISW